MRSILLSEASFVYVCQTQVSGCSLYHVPCLSCLSFLESSHFCFVSCLEVTSRNTHGLFWLCIQNDSWQCLGLRKKCQASKVCIQPNLAVCTASTVVLLLESALRAAPSQLIHLLLSFHQLLHQSLIVGDPQGLSQAKMVEQPAKDLLNPVAQVDSPLGGSSVHSSLILAVCVNQAWECSFSILMYCRSFYKKGKKVRRQKGRERQYQVFLTFWCPWLKIQRFTTLNRVRED